MEMINVAELLKDCPEGMELDCTMFENVTFLKVDMRRKQFPIEIAVSGIRSRYLTKEGCFHDTTLSPESKCVIFPKGKTTWEGFVSPVEFKDGDIVAFDDDDGNTLLFIYKEIIDANEGYSVCYLMIDYDGGLNLVEGDYYINRLATEEEKQKLFKTIKDNGYNWNAETKVLEELITPLVTPYFKVGDRIRHKEETKWTCVIRRIDDRYWVDEHPTCYTIPFGKQDEYELVPDKFDITALKPFDNCKYSLDGGITWKYAQYWFIQEKYNTNDISIELWQG